MEIIGLFILKTISSKNSSNFTPQLWHSKGGGVGIKLVTSPTLDDVN